MATRKQQLGKDIRHSRGDFEATKTGDIDRVEGLDNLDQALFHRLLTSPGTLVHRPDYGVGIKDWVGQLTTVDKQRDLALRISEQYNKDPRVDVVNQVRFEVNDANPDLFLIFVKYVAVGYNETESIFDPFELGA